MNFVALASALSAALANTTAGAASRRIHPSYVLLASSPISLLLIIPAIAIVGGVPTSASLVWGLVAGVAGVFALSLAFVALGRGPIGAVTAAIASSQTVLLTVAGFASGDAVTPARLIALALCLAAIVFVTYAPGQSLRGNLGGPALGIVVGLGFACFGLAIAQVDTSERLWPLLPARGVIVVLAIVVALIVRARTAARLDRTMLTRATVGLVVLAGVFDIATHITLLLALQLSDLTTVGLNTSVSPVFAALLGAIFLAERMRPLQIVGLALAVLGSAVVALS